MANGAVQTKVEFFFEKTNLNESHHAEGRVDPKVREHQNGFRFWIPQSM
jgi:hypothetical protein